MCQIRIDLLEFKIIITFSGLEDIVRCYACDGGLRKWNPADDPWIEHARLFPHCMHVIRERGQEYIDLINVDTANDAEPMDIEVMTQT